MKKKTIGASAIIAALLLTVTIPQVQAFAVSALSVFRVDGTRTINISLDDISQMAVAAKEYAEANKDRFEEHRQGEYKKPYADKYDYKMLTDINEFTAFNVNLPRELSNQQAELFATDIIEKSIQMQNGESIMVSISPTLVAKYENVAFMATQGMNNSMSSETKAEIWQKVLSAPILTENIRVQLAAIDPNTKDIYLPVITGISREADLGSTTGYLYATSDIQGIMSALPTELTAELQDTHAATPEHKNANAIVWTKSDVLYVLVGNLSDSELIAIARSVR